MRLLRMTVVVIAVMIVTGSLAGCGQGGELTGSAAGSAPKRVTVITADISASTLGQRDRYVDDVMAAIVGTAELDGAVYVSTVDGLATNDVWQLPDRRFTSSIGGGNPTLARAARSHQAERLRPEVRRLLHGRGRGGSDLLAMLTNVRRLLCTLPDAERRVVIVSDGGVLAGGVNLYRQPPRTEFARRHLIGRLRRSGEIPPDLDCRVGSPVRVWLSGLGIGIARRDIAMAVRRFYVEVIESTGAVVAAEGPQLLERSFGDDSLREAGVLEEARASVDGHVRPRRRPQRYRKSVL